MEAGAAVWVRDTSGRRAWVQATVLEKGEEGEDLTAEVVVEVEGEPLYRRYRLSNGNQEHELMKLRNDSKHSTADDLAQLPHLHEPAILHALNARYDRGIIYSNTGAILIAVNPFRNFPHLYTHEVMETYFQRGLQASKGNLPRKLPPHVYAIADSAYRAMMVSLVQDQNAPAGMRNHSILISGESGAGKTESTKIVMNYLATVGSTSSNDKHVITPASIMDKVLQSNPILEAFGNARTLRNGNSSRFGKFIEMHFSRGGQLIGASIRTYLLEKFRLCKPHQIGDRNFHAFYQMCAGVSDKERKRLKLQQASGYTYTQFGEFDSVEQSRDAEGWRSLCQALSILNFQSEEYEALIRCMSGILHLGNCAFQSIEDKEYAEIDSSSNLALSYAAEFLGLELNALTACMISKRMETRDETFILNLQPDQCYDARDALAKFLYGRLFDWLVLRINESIDCSGSMSYASISVLDIFGFESFLSNSLEQLLINYTNETLQQHFNCHVLKLEQEEYEAEQIKWSHVNFSQNSEIISLLDDRIIGIFAILDDQSSLSQGSDSLTVSRIYTQHARHGRLVAGPSQQNSGLFTVVHFAGPVEYNSKGFVDKNRDTLPSDAYCLFAESTEPLVRRLFTDEQLVTNQNPNYRSGKRGKGRGKQTICSQFKESLQVLMSRIERTTPHYIRCIKPNDDCISGMFDRARVVEQLRYAGLLEAVRVTREGFAVRLPHSVFYTQYRMLVSGAPTLDELLTEEDYSDNTSGHLHELAHAHAKARRMKSACASLVLNLVESYADNLEANEQGLPSNQNVHVQVGKTKVFMRKDVYDKLESVRVKKLWAAAVVVQTFVRGRLYRIRYTRMRKSAVTVARCARGMLARFRVKVLRITIAKHKAQMAQRERERLILENERQENAQRQAVQIMPQPIGPIPETTVDRSAANKLDSKSSGRQSTTEADLVVRLQRMKQQLMIERTKRKKAEERAKLLTAEIQHWTKSALLSVAGNSSRVQFSNSPEQAEGEDLNGQTDSDETEGEAAEIRSRLGVGLPVTVWEMGGISAAQCVMCLCPAPANTLHFSATRQNSGATIVEVPLAQVKSLGPGHKDYQRISFSRATDESAFLYVLAQTRNVKRCIIIQTASRQERNVILSALKLLIKPANVHSTVSGLARSVLFQLASSAKPQRQEVERLALRTLDLVSELQRKDEELRALKTQLQLGATSHSDGAVPSTPNSVSAPNRDKNSNGFVRILSRLKSKKQISKAAQPS